MNSTPATNRAYVLAQAIEDTLYGDEVAAEWAADIRHLGDALVRAHEQLDKFGMKGPKQVGRASLTIEKALGWNLLDDLQG